MYQQFTSEGLGSHSCLLDHLLHRIAALILAICTIILSLDAAKQAYSAEKRSVPNIVIILADDLGYGDVSCYGATKVKTPSVDRLAREGLRFTDGYATAATCTPSRYSLLTGEYAWRRKGTGVAPGDAAMIIKPGRTTLASILRQAGYATGAVGKWHLGLGDGQIDWNTTIKPNASDIGFDYSFLIPATGDRVPCVFVENGRVVGLDPADPIRVNYGKPVGNEPTGKEHPELLKMRPSHGHDMTIVNGISRIGYMSGGKAARWVDEDMADTLTRKAVAFLEQNQKRPFFLYFATHDIHVPRVPHPRFVGKTDMGPRGDVIAQFDWSVGEVLAALDRLELAQNTLVILSSDNGPVVDDGYRDEAVKRLGGHRPSGPLRGGKYSRFDGGTRVPFIVRWPARVKPGVSDAIVSQVDFPASFAALTGQKLADDDAPDSLNILPALLGEAKQGRDHIIEEGISGVALRQGKWKYMEPNRGLKFKENTSTEMGNDPQPQLYDFSGDLGEKKNVAAENPEKVKELQLLLDRIRTGDSPR